MAILNGEIVVFSVNVGGDDGGKVAIVLFGVGSIHGVNQTFGIGVSLVGWMRRPVVQHGLIDWIRRFVWEDTGTQKADQFLDIVDAATFHDIVVDEDILAKEFHWRKQG